MIRRIGALFFVLALSVVVMADVDAQTQPNFSDCSNRTVEVAFCSSEASAIAGMTSIMNQYCAAGSNYRDCPWAVTVQPTCVAFDRPTSTHDCNMSFTWRTNSGTSGTSHVLRRVGKITCPSGQQWNEVLQQCTAPCNTKPPMTSVRFPVVGGSPNTTCSGGCEYAVDLQGGSGTTGLTTIGGASWYRAASMSPTGSTCTSGNQPLGNETQACATQGNLTQCVKPDGQHCATASTGKQFCWQPGENGIKASGNDAATKSPDGQTPKPPPLPPNNGGDWTQTGQSTVITNTNGTPSTSTVTGWQSNYGGQGQGASGGGASGEGNSGNGSGSGLGNGNGNGNGDDEGDDDGPGGPGAGVGDLYTPTDKTIASVFNAFKSRVGNAPLVSSINDFFTVNATGGCPVFNLPASDYWEATSYDAHCSGGILEALQAIGWVLMAAAAFFAAMWALS